MTPSIDAKALAAGRTVAGQQFVLPSSQSSWKPFFLPLDMPLILQASGTMRPRNDAQPTGPEGIEVPPGPSWSYPGARDIVVDGTHRLIDPSIRYQALIGRVCDGRGCGPTFAVGRQHVLCPTGASRAWLELWINHIVGPAGLLGRSTTLSLDAFDLQTRVGEYRFSVAAAPANACVSAPVRRP